MIELYVNKLFETLPKNIKNDKKPIEIDLVLEGGAFNGSYLVGSLLFLKKLDKHHIIEIKRISGSSIGSFMGLLYFMDSLDLVYELYDIILNDFKKNYFININNIITNHFKNVVPSNICSKIDNKLYISYNNIKKRKKITVSKYKNVDFLLDTIIKSCFMPIFIDKKIFYKNKYVDGFLPYIFPLQKQRKILYLDITSNSKMYSSLNVKNENSNFHRVMAGLIDTHKFFIKNHNTEFCSYVNDWGITKKVYNKCKNMLERFFIYILFIIYTSNKYITHENRNHFIYKTIQKCFYTLYVSFVKKYCI